MNDDVISILKNVGAVITESHFVLTSGRHSPAYINKDALYPHTESSSEVGKLFAEKFSDLDIDVVAAPALGGIILSQWTAYHLGQLKNKEVLGVYTEKGPDKSMIFTRGYDKLVVGKKVLVIEDLTSTGGSVKKVVDVVRAAGGEVVAVGVMVNRDPKLVTKESIGVSDFRALGVMEVVSYEEAECELCKNGVPVNTQVGHGKKYLEAKAGNAV
ncbi:orotate phosphoribosyltransferase [Candidatus Roizmanbacteria bacterium]|nr:orotate phosphoribosyltransferase [Candidatus Roizmanbacteria bacterium]